VQGNFFRVERINDRSIEDLNKYVYNKVKQIIEGGKPAAIKVEAYKAQRSLTANRLVWVWHGEIADYLNSIGKRVDILKENENGKLEKIGDRPYEKEDIHYQMKAKFLGMVKIKCGNSIREEPRNSSDLEHNDFCYWMSQIEEMAFDYWGLVLKVQAKDEYSRYKEAQLI